MKQLPIEFENRMKTLLGDVFEDFVKSFDAVADDTPEVPNISSIEELAPVISKNTVLSVASLIVDNENTEL